MWQNILLAILLLYALFGFSIVRATEDDLDDFDFSDIDLSYKSDPLDATVHQASIDEDWEKDSNSIPGAAFFQTHGEKTLRKALAKALTNKTLRQRFLEILPILRVLTSQQRLTLSALISAQMIASRSNPLKLAEVRSMFGDDKKVLLPIMFDIANLLSSLAFQYMPADNATLDTPELENSINRRGFEVNAFEDEEEQQMLGIEDLSEEILDPQSINEKLMEPMPSQQRRKRSLANGGGEQLVHKLFRVTPTYTAQEPNLEYENSRMLRINVSGFQIEQNNMTDSNYQRVEDLALSHLNSSLEENVTTVPQTDDEILPTPEELISGPRYHLTKNKKRPAVRKAVAIRKRVQVQVPQNSRANTGAQLPLPRKCERFTASICIRSDDYPL